ncbi:hypothetical protein FA95DRAFT_1605838 [Auriscalpium vulgare]|uniref:Uncharacterized protein n=1 Tax=Auriscalpium vulgare TaxID=40419 RepID=A0ACB8RVQ2_9AGAM|nr:hypothetical protein FA95DRAFT_1605838 [Auriscalpium vulgare]
MLCTASPSFKQVLTLSNTPLDWPSPSSPGSTNVFPRVIGLGFYLPGSPVRAGVSASESLSVPPVADTTLRARMPQASDRGVVPEAKVQRSCIKGSRPARLESPVIDTSNHRYSVHTLGQVPPPTIIVDDAALSLPGGAIDKRNSAKSVKGRISTPHPKCAKRLEFAQ